MAKYSEFRNFMYDGGVSEDFLRCCDYVNCCDSMGGFLLYAGIVGSNARSFNDFYSGWIRERYYDDGRFRILVDKMYYEEGFKGSKCRADFKGYCRYFVEELGRWYGRFKEVVWGEGKTVYCGGFSVVNRL